MVAATYSSEGGASGGPLLENVKGKVFIVGVHHGGGAIGIYTFDKMREYFEHGVLIP